MQAESAAAYSHPSSSYENRRGPLGPHRTEGLLPGFQEARQLAAQIVQLTHANLPPEEFYTEFLKLVVRGLGAYRGMVWLTKEGEKANLLAEVHIPDAELSPPVPIPPGWEEQSWHQELLHRAVQTPLAAPPQGPDPGSYPRGDTASGVSESRNPTGWLLLFAPMVSEGEAAAPVVELVLPGPFRLAAPKQLRLLAQMVALASRYFRRRRIAQLQADLKFWQQVEEFSRQVHGRLESRWVGYTFVNEGRRLLGCDRLSLLVAEGNRCRPLAISGSSELEPRSPTLRLLGRLTAAVLAGKEPLCYTGATEGLPPQIQPLLESYVDRTHTKALLILPLWPSEQLQPQPNRPAPGPTGQTLGVEAAATDSVRSSRTWPIGALVLEQFETAEIPEQMRGRLEMLARHGQTALSHSVQYEGIFLRPVWEALGRLGWVVWSRSWPKWAWVAATGMVLVLMFIFTPSRWETEAIGTLEPVVRQDVFAGIDGRVEKVLAAHGARVEGPDPQKGRPGTLLCILRNYELEEEMARLTGERATVEERLAAVNRALLERPLSPVESDRLSAEQGWLRQRLQSLDAQLAVCRRKQEQLYIYSPIHGQVITWDVAALLQHRPVQRGDRLLRIAQTDGPWQVELHVPEDRIGHVLRAQQTSDSPLRVRFLLAADPTTTYEGQLVEIDSNTQDHPGQGRCVLARVQIEANQISPLLPGSQVRARIDCGRCSLGYRWFHDLWAWLRRMWFRW